MRLKQSLIIALVALSAPFTTALASVVISELMWSGTDLSSADEWIEISNTESFPVSLSGWTITKRSGTGNITIAELPEGSSIPANGTFLISNYDSEHSRLGIEPDFVTSSMSLPNTKLLIGLFNANRTQIDIVDDGIGAPFAGSNSNPKASMERIDLSGSGQLKSNWQTAGTFINFDDGARLYGTPGAQNGTGASIDTFAPQEATTFSAEVTKSGSLIVSWIPSTSLDLYSQELSCSSPVENGTGWTLSAEESEMVFSGESETGITFTLKSTDDLGNTSSGISVISTTSPDVRITEVLANPKGADDEEWIEIGNLGSEPANITGWVLDEGNSPGAFLIPESVLAGGEHRSYRKSESGLPLGNKGEKLSLMRGNTMIDSWVYPETAEEVSYGRDYDNPDLLRMFCVPTEGKPNTAVPTEPKISLQSGLLNGVNVISSNLIAEVSTGSTVHAVCNWDYGDGYTSDSCNPPSHSFNKPGTYSITLTYTDFCGDTSSVSVIATVIEEIPEENNSNSEGGGGGSSGGSSRSGGGAGDGGRTSCSTFTYEGIRVSEFIPNPKGKDEAPFAPTEAMGARGEWIELENLNPQNVSLCGWEIDDVDGGSKPYSLDTYRIAANQFLLIPRSDTKIALNNNGDTVRLFGPQNILEQEVKYEKVPEGQSFALHNSGSFIWTKTPTPGRKNIFEIYEGVDQEISQEVKIEETEEAKEKEGISLGSFIPPIFSEILSNPPLEGSLHDLGEYIEFFNPTLETIDISGCILDDSPNGSSKPQTLPDGTVIPANSYILFCDGEECDYPLKVSLNNEGEELSLTSPDRSKTIKVTYPKMKRGEAYAFKGDFCHTKVATPGEKNICRTTYVANRTSQEKTSKRKTKNKSPTTLVAKKVDPLAKLKKRYRNIFPVKDLEHGQEIKKSHPLLVSLTSRITNPDLPPSLVRTGSDDARSAVPLRAHIIIITFLILLTGFVKAKVSARNNQVSRP